MPHIIIFNPKNGTRTQHALEKKLTKIGRLSDNDIILTDGRVSRYHAEIIRQTEDDYLVQDLNSSNGTKVNGTKVYNKKLKDEDWMDIGRFILTFKMADLSESALVTPSPPLQSDGTDSMAADNQDDATIVGGETSIHFDTEHGEFGEGAGEKTALSTTGPSTLISPETGTDKLDSRVELLAKKLKGKAGSPNTEVLKSTVSPPPPSLKGTKTAYVPPPFTAHPAEGLAVEEDAAPTRAKVIPLKKPGYRTRATDLLELFYSNEVISEVELNQFIQEVKETTATPYQAISKKSLYYRRGGLDTLKNHFKLPFLESDDEIVKLFEKTSITEDTARRCIALPIKEETEEGKKSNGYYLPVIMADPSDVYAIDELNLAAKIPVKPISFSTPEVIKKAISRVYKTTISTTALDLAGINVEIGKKELTVEEVTGFPIVDMVNYFINKALNERASDIHFEPTEHFLVIRNRIDGVLHETAALPDYLHPEIVSRIKIICEMNVAEKRLPQDVRFSVTIGDKQVDVRVSTYPTVHGEKVVLRLLEQEALITDVNRLGMEDSEVELLIEKITAPHGMVLLTGPTGCGKTTTLYACISMINSQDINILTVEDPVEYKIPGIYQMQSNEKIGLTFAAGLRTMLRQDPDVIMVGEIRDQETAEIAIRAAITGHIVFSTLHTNDAVGIVIRLTDMHIDPFLVASSLSLAIAQRLYRTICEDCRIYVEPKIILDNLKEAGVAERRLHHLGLDISEDREYSIGKGCPKCRGTGYFGRRALFEIFDLTKEAKDMIISKDFSESELKKLAVQDGMKTLLQAGRRVVDRGITTVEEVIRVCGEG
ncbi:MAG: Flp pilus assembly complex ATPase component TadA [Deltaproteobacteria bacterium]|nr:Flp pilus assembly complex ATPase component TadA [Deltaproteobacteria bacterium]